MILKKLGWRQFKKKLLVKIQRDSYGGFKLLYVDTINNCILHEYQAPIRDWEKWELEIVYGIFRIQLKEMME